MTDQANPLPEVSELVSRLRNNCFSRPRCQFMSLPDGTRPSPCVVCQAADALERYERQHRQLRELLIGHLKWCSSICVHWDALKDIIEEN